ncbi:pre-mRNA-splicing factor prp46 [Yamadazyma tenuis]|uniref:Pre-mRNA-splicing factor PRP46 n=1 Tax=Candida tenuis (strain ATCC 10573 / BCRC 21748 / CBS 615 / JCM 9827 / NBRC 10315 / NRRL Y-1498 / VKM Y-70) TaxID=590646 RepID=G3AXU7_CANTC|nr:WD40 repeat-like protein [Yamadazyma tenuis ATCC 10573]EGV65699.1 WD40 repeat-like protein [Yamadazyma tenuis ATCC 10573]WEJ95985.1 pre-mRNA-splicing factor prp46 [Yamadazyma tenuis]
MLAFDELIDVDDQLVPPPDTLSTALYTNNKLDYMLRNVDENLPLQSELDSSPSPEPQSQTITNNSHSTTTTNWKLLRVIAGAHTGWVRSLTVDPVTNQWFVTGGTDATIKVWDLANSSCKAIITGHIMAVRALVVSKKFPYLFSGSEDKEVKCFDLERSNSVSGCEIRNYHGHLGGIYTMALHPQLDLLFTGGRDQTVRVWDIRSRAEVMTLTGHKSDISSLIASEVDPQLISSSMDGTIRLWDIRKQTTELTLTHHSKSIRSMVEHPAESTFCSGDSSGNIKQWLFPQGELLNEFNSTDKNIINTMAVNHTNNNLFAGYDNGQFEIFDYVSGELLQSSKTIPSPGSTESSIFCSSFDLSGLRLVTGESDHSVKIWGEETQ